MWLLVGAISGCLVLSMLHAGSQISPSPLKVGVVDLFKVVDGYQKKKDREVEINKVREAAGASLKDLQKRIEGMVSELELVDKNSPDFPTRKKLISEKQEELLMKTRLAEREVMEKLEQFLQEIYSEILARIGEYQQKNQFDFIFRIDARPLTNQERIIDQLDRKLLMASAKTFDITDDVTAFLNQSYSAR
jgi:Skp family chaperone for outer membrane proteins